MVKMFSFVLVGGLIGALLGYFGKCTSGTCPFTANPFRGAGFGALFGLLFALSSYGNPLQKREPVAESTNIVHVADAAELDRLLADAKVPVMLDFYADWCGPCRKLGPELSKLADQWGDGARIVKINVDKHRDLAGRFNVSSIPDVRVFMGGVEKQRAMGYRPQAKLGELLAAAGGIPGNTPVAESPVKSESVEEKANHNEGSDDMSIVLKVGDKAPDFNLADQNGKAVRLADFAGKKLLVYFYPKADTPGCTKQSCEVSESLAVLREAGLEAVGISPDSPEQQKKFDEKYSLGFPLLADEQKTVSEAYGVWGEKSMYGKRFFGIVRSAFVVGEDGKLLAVGYKISPSDTVPFAKAAASDK